MSAFYYPLRVACLLTSSAKISVRVRKLAQCFLKAGWVPTIIAACRPEKETSPVQYHVDGITIVRLPHELFGYLSLQYPLEGAIFEGPLNTLSGNPVSFPLLENSLLEREILGLPNGKELLSSSALYSYAQSSLGQRASVYVACDHLQLVSGYVWAALYDSELWYDGIYPYDPSDPQDLVLNVESIVLEACQTALVRERERADFLYSRHAVQEPLVISDEALTELSDGLSKGTPLAYGSASLRTLYDRLTWSSPTPYYHNSVARLLSDLRFSYLQEDARGVRLRRAQIEAICKGAL